MRIVNRLANTLSQFSHESTAWSISPQWFKSLETSFNVPTSAKPNHDGASGTQWRGGHPRGLNRLLRGGLKPAEVDRLFREGAAGSKVTRQHFDGYASHHVQDRQKSIALVRGLCERQSRSTSLANAARQTLRLLGPIFILRCGDGTAMSYSYRRAVIRSVRDARRAGR
jgi:hypothetical protein